MKRVLVLAVSFALFAVSMVEAGTFPVEVVIKKSTRKTKAKDSAQTDDTKDRTTTFTAQLKNTSLMEGFSDLDFQVYVVGVNHAFESKNKVYQVTKVIKKEDVSIKKMEKKRVKLGDVNFAAWQARNGDFLWRGGMEYEGFVCEIYSDGRLVAKESSGGRKCREAYEEYLNR